MGIEPPHDRGCRNCGKIGHIAKNCPHQKLCSYCKRAGHLVKNCPSKTQRKKNKNVDYKVQTDKFSVHDNIHQSDVKSLHGPPIMIQSNDMRKGFVTPDRAPRLPDDRKMLQMGYVNRHPPPGFATNFNSPPPGFKPKFPTHTNGTNFNRMRCPTPLILQHPQSMNELSQSPPKHYSSSPPKNYQRNNAYQKLPESIPSLNMRPGLLPDPPMPHPDPRNWIRQPKHPNSFPQRQRGMPKTDWDW